ncbi:hypothetical protein BJ944DRAFT_271048 [Cunninghamella echinulata]|nr:hypothetical protein BJ944DRAFT_271048 [Cunninghamella echinulata]
MLETCQRKKSNRPHVRTACVNCKKAHLACDAERPCKRCISVGKTDSCYDIQHKKRGRPKIRDKLALMNTNSTPTSTSFSLFDTNNNNNNNNDNNNNNNTIHHHSPLYPIKLIKETFPPSTSLIDPYTPFLPLSSSSFDMTKPSQDIHMKKNESMMTIFLTTEMCCARVSDECIEFIGYHPKELAHRSLYDFVTNPKELHQIHQQLEQSYKQQCNHYYDPSSSTNHCTTTAITTKEDDYYKMSPRTLLSIANGSKTFKMILKLKSIYGKEEETVTNAMFYFGGGLGGNLCQPTTLEKLYIVCVLTKMNNNNQHYSLLSSSSSSSSSIGTTSPPITTPPLLSSLLLNHDPLQYYSSSPSSSSSSSSLSSSSPIHSMNDISSSSTSSDPPSVSSIIMSSQQQQQQNIPISISPTTATLTNNSIVPTTSTMPLSSSVSTIDSLLMTPPYTNIQTPTSFNQDESLYSWLNLTFPSSS